MAACRPVKPGQVFRLVFERGMITDIIEVPAPQKDFVWDMDGKPVGLSRSQLQKMKTYMDKIADAKNKKQPGDLPRQT